jgi:hypothetical protein
MNFIKNLIAKLIGRKLNETTGQMEGVSRTKLIAIIGVIIAAIPPLSTAWGHPIVIPPEILKFLEAAGLYTLRDSIK